MNSTFAIQINNVSVTYGNNKILNEIDFTLENDEFCYIIGKTGAGKSSFLKLIYRDVIPASGTVFVADYEVTNLPDNKVPFLRRRLGIVFQDFQLLPDRNVFDNVAFALQVTGNGKRFIKNRVLEVLGLVGLSHRRNGMPDDLSGGEKQRVVIARALANEPRLLLADEPTGNLDPDASSSIMELLQQINNRGMAVLMVTHDYEVIRKFPSRTVEIKNGTLKNVTLK
ncbi:MAG: cell division ATP-binding protein FtsE [Balneolaceae bacterium]